MTIWPSGELATTPPTIDPLVSLAVNMLAAPGTYAILAGSGLSRAAGIMTGDEVLCDLITRVAKAEGVEVTEPGWSPKAWWAAARGSEPGYDQILAELAPTDAMRQVQLAPYFEADSIHPTPAHTAIADLCKRGLVQVIITTNFDRLIERALEHAGVKYQMAHDEQMLAGLAPLVRGVVTVLKVHGDYRQGPMRNTAGELGTYPPKLQRYLARVLEEFGVLSMGWSATYDVALARALGARLSRRYPLYFAAYQGKTETAAKELIAVREGRVISHAGADRFFADLAERIARLEREAVQHSRPTRMKAGAGIIQYQNNQVLPGWATVPLLRLEVAAQFSEQNDYDIFRAGDRAELASALDANVLRFMLAAEAMQDRPGPGAALKPSVLLRGDPPPQPIPGMWELNPEWENSANQCHFRLGGNASDGISALAMALLPRAQMAGSTTSFIVEMGFSLKRMLDLSAVARTLIEGLLLVTDVMPRTTVRAQSAGTRLAAAEIMIRAKADPKTPADQTPGPITARLNCAPFGTRQSNEHKDLYRYGLMLDGRTPTRDEAAEAVVDAIELMAYELGYLDPRSAIKELRRQLGLPAIN
ncbi:MAG: SIR2 family protein [Actinomycetota bacterium]|nr:SIR2 family protein [Actinomycetota bacterium]MDA8374164.1 SIR2 family protein [Actinomycetota bacterium]